MIRNFLLITMALGLSSFQISAQPVVKTFTTRFVPHSVTYNGSDNPNECWESVAWGIIIEDGKNSYFFSLGYQDLELLKEKIGDAEVIVDVVFYDEPSDYGGGEDGNVTKVTLNGTVIFGD